MSVDELWSLHEEVSTILSARILQEKSELEKRLAILNRGTGITQGSGASPDGKLRRRYPKVLPRYRNPETLETWSGRGKRPRWVAVAMDAGHDVEDFLIGESGPALPHTHAR